MPQAPRHRRENPDDAASDEELLALCFDEIIAGIDKHRHTFAVAGTAESSSGRFREMAFTARLGKGAQPVQAARSS